MFVPSNGCNTNCLSDVYFVARTRSLVDHTRNMVHSVFQREKRTNTPCVPDYFENVFFFRKIVQLLEKCSTDFFVFGTKGYSYIKITSFVEQPLRYNVFVVCIWHFLKVSYNRFDESHGETNVFEFLFYSCYFVAEI